MNSTLALFALLLTVSFGTPDGSFTPVEVSEHALLFFVRPENSSGELTMSCSDRREVLYVCDPVSHPEPQVVWSGKVPGPWPIARLDRNTVLFERQSNHLLLNLRTGETTLLLEPGVETEFLSSSGGTAFFLKRSSLRGWRSHGYELGRSETNAEITVMKNYVRPRDQLYVYDVNAEAKAKRVASLEIDRVLHCDGESTWVISSGDAEHKGRKLCKLARDGKVEEIIAVDDHWVAPEIRFHLSPSGAFLALAILHDEHDVHRERELAIVDLAKKQIVYSKERITDLEPYCSSLPTSSVHWEGDSLLSYGFWNGRDIDLSSPEIEEKPTPEVVPGSVSFLWRQSIGFFDHEPGSLFFHGETTPIADGLSRPNGVLSTFGMDSRGEWAAFVSKDKPDLFLVEGREKQKSLLLPGWCYGLRWFAEM